MITISEQDLYIVADELDRNADMLDICDENDLDDVETAAENLHRVADDLRGIAALALKRARTEPAADAAAEG